jgi:hypothetical protein
VSTLPFCIVVNLIAAHTPLERVELDSGLEAIGSSRTFAPAKPVPPSQLHGIAENRWRGIE